MAEAAPSNERQLLAQPATGFSTERAGLRVASDYRFQHRSQGAGRECLPLSHYVVSHCPGQMSRKKSSSVAIGGGADPNNTVQHRKNRSKQANPFMHFEAARSEIQIARSPLVSLY